MMKKPGVDWKVLRTATGTAEEIPTALLGLCSADKKTREVAYWKIDNHAVLQGDLYEVAPFAVAAVIDCLRSGPSSKDEIYNLLVEFANGYAPDTATVQIEGSDLPLKDATTRELAKGLELYWLDVHACAITTRRRVAELLLVLSEDVSLDAAKVRSALWSQRYRSDPLQR
jgi:hypothetical protein